MKKQLDRKTQRPSSKNSEQTRISLAAEWKKFYSLVMQVGKVCEQIQQAEEFVLDKQSLSGISEAVLETKEDREMLIKALLASFWQLPKLKAQEEWIKIVIQLLAKREDAQEMFTLFMEQLKQQWLQISIRIIEKFIMLLDELIKHFAAKYPTPLEQYLTRGPDARYDVVVMKRVLKARKILTDEEKKHLLNYLFKNGDTYFGLFFRRVALPMLQRQGITEEMAKTAYEHGSKKGAPKLLRELLYDVYAIRKKKQQIENKINQVSMTKSANDK